MCGIFGIYSGDKNRNVIQSIEHGLAQLEYRGYDSCGICMLDSTKKAQFQSIKAVGTVEQLKNNPNYPLNGQVGIGHVRWGTSGEINVENAHPHITNNTAIVHNGIVENTEEVLSIINKNDIFVNYNKNSSDSMLIPPLINALEEDFAKKEQNANPREVFIKAFINTCQIIKGHSAVLTLKKLELKEETDKDKFIFGCTSDGCSLYIGKDKNDIIFSSDPLPLEHCSKIYQLKKKEILIVDQGTIYRINGDLDNYQKEEVEFEDNKSFNVEKVQQSKQIAAYKHITRSEIQEQPGITNQIFNLYFKKEKKADKTIYRFKEDVKLVKIKEASKISQINFIASGSSLNASFIIGKFIESKLGIPSSYHYGSEFAYTSHNINPNKDQLGVFISQSGETLDSIISIEKATQFHMQCIGLINSQYSTMKNMLQETINCLGTKEIGIAATKSFLSQTMTGIIFSLQLGRLTNKILPEEEEDIIRKLSQIPEAIDFSISVEDKIKNISKKLSSAKLIQFIGKNIAFGMAMEGSLKMKELSYIPSEALYSGELKHGHLALVDSQSWCVCPLLDDNLKEKTINNLHEIITRKGNVIVISNTEKLEQSLQIDNVHHIYIPYINDIANIFSIITVEQLLAYHTADALNREIDRPRNLAKSITVE